MERCFGRLVRKQSVHQRVVLEERESIVPGDPGDLAVRILFSEPMKDTRGSQNVADSVELDDQDTCLYRLIMRTISALQPLAFIEHAWPVAGKMSAVSFQDHGVNGFLIVRK